jgi:hypothetical protein
VLKPTQEGSALQVVASVAGLEGAVTRMRSPRLESIQLLKV